MTANARHVINMANSIVGVSILSMPYCFKEAGMLLGIVLLLLSGFITKKTCMFLVRSAIMARRRSYEFLAFHVFGVSGKLFVELCMILFLIGICISFHVVMGDLAPAIVARFLEVENSPSLRCTLLIGIVLLVILPLCLLRNLDSLASMSACSICFYFFLITVIFWHAFPKLWDGSWYLTADLWRPAGAFQVLPICCLAVACQSNVFEIYDSVPDPDVPKMRSVVNGAVNLCTALYIAVGFLGYVAFVDKDLSGNVIMNFPNSNLTEGIKMFFTVSLAISFPLMIFPCRTSIHSLLYRRSNPSSYDLVGNYMPEARFKGITCGILLVSLVVGILIPNIELVLGLLGSTMGMLIALILPSLLFIKVNSKASAERLIAQGIMLMGLVLIVTGTYLNVSHISEVQTASKIEPTEAIEKVNLDLKMGQIADVAKVAVEASQSADNSATRKEPVAPEPPPEEVEKKEVPAEPVEKEEVKKEVAEEKLSDSKDDKIVHALDAKDESLAKADTKDEKGIGDTLHPDAIKKEEKENKEEGDSDKKIQAEQFEKKQAELLEKIEEQQEEQKKILAEQKEILKELKDHKNKQDEDAKKKNVDDKGNELVSPVNPAVGDNAANLVGHAEPALVIQNLADQGVPQDLKSTLLKDNPEPLPAFVAPNSKNAYQVNPQLPNQPEAVAYQNVPVKPANQVPQLNQQAVVGGQQVQPVGISDAQKNEQFAQAGNQLAYANDNIANVAKQPANAANLPVNVANPPVNAASLPANIVNQPIYAINQPGYLGNHHVYVANQPGNVANQAGYIANGPQYVANQPPYVANPVPLDSRAGYAGAQIPNAGGQGAVGSNSLPLATNYRAPAAVGNNQAAPVANNIYIPLSGSAQHSNKFAAEAKVAPEGDLGKYAQNQPRPAGNTLGEPGQKDAGVPKSGGSVNLDQGNQNPLDSGAEKEQQSKQGRPVKVPVIKNYVKKEAPKKELDEPNLTAKKQASESLLAKKSQKKQAKKLKEVEESKREKKSKTHDEERRKRQIEAHNSLDFPEVDLLREGVLRDIGDVAYDTRHLLWTHRRRKKKRPNRNRDYQYWDET